MSKPEAYSALIAADRAWSAELALRFGRQAGDVRYTPAGRGEPGSGLRQLYDAFRAASDELHAAFAA